MYLDKTKLHLLLDKAEKLPTSSNNVNNYGSSPLLSQLKTILGSLSTWLTKHPNLTNGVNYGKRLTELRSKLPDPKRQSWIQEKDVAEFRTQTLALIRLIDRENKSVFIVHGRDMVMREAVENALRGLNIPTVVLAREEDSGQTVIEKFVKQAARCEYAVVLCSADDEGRLRPKGRTKELPAAQPRARQNVVLELGYFLGKLGRSNVFVMHPEEHIEQPSDFTGVVYQVFDKAGGWRRKLASELKAAGFKFSPTLVERM